MNHNKKKNSNSTPNLFRKAPRYFIPPQKFLSWFSRNKFTKMFLLTKSSIMCRRGHVKHTCKLTNMVLERVRKRWPFADNGGGAMRGKIDASHRTLRNRLLYFVGSLYCLVIAFGV